MKVFLVGAAGGIGLRLSRLLSDSGTEVTGMHRKADQGDVMKAAGAVPVVGDPDRQFDRGFDGKGGRP